MSTTVFTDYVTPVPAAWLNDVNVAVYAAIGNGTVAPKTAADVLNNLAIPSTYLTQTNATATYLTQANAATTYLTQANAAATYLTIGGTVTNATNLTGSGTVSATTTGGASLTPTTATNATNLLNTASTNLPSIDCTQATGALTFSAVAQYLTFRNVSLTSGTPTTINASPANLVLPSGGTLGAVTTVSARIVLVEMNNAGTAELAIANIAGGLDMSETALISTTAIGAGSTANNVWYSTTARTNLAYRVIGAFDVVNTAGAWGSPTTKINAGGQAQLKSASMVQLNTANGYGSTNTTIRRFTNVVTNQGSDITYADSATLGASFTINTNGVYAISYTDNFSVSDQLGISLNSNQLTTAIQSITITNSLGATSTSAANGQSTHSVTAYLSAGSVIRPHTGGTGTGTNRTFFTTTRVA